MLLSGCAMRWAKSASSVALRPSWRPMSRAIRVNCVDGRVEPGHDERRSSAAVEDVVAEVLHFEDGGVGAAGNRVGEMGFDHLGDDDVVVALFDDAGDLA